MGTFVIVFIISISFSAGFLFGAFWAGTHQNKDYTNTTFEGSERRGGINPKPVPPRPCTPPPAQPKKIK